MNALFWPAFLLSLLFVGRSESPPEIPDLICHRTAVAGAPENTLIGIEKAIEARCQAVEVDVRVTADGRVILLHDDSLSRTTTGRGRVGELTYAAIRELDAGIKTSPKYRGTRIPTLEEAIELARDRIQLYLDIKVTNPRPVAEVVTKSKFSASVFYRVYTLSAARKIQRLDPQSRLVFDFGALSQVPGVIEEAAGAFPNLTLSSDLGNWDRQLIATARSFGLPVFINVLGCGSGPGSSENLEAGNVPGRGHLPKPGNAAGNGNCRDLLARAAAFQPDAILTDAPAAGFREALALRVP